MGKQIGLMTSVLVLLTAVNVRATIIELTGFTGELKTFPNESADTFSIGHSFLSIDNVKIRAMGTFTPGIAHGDGASIPIHEEIEVLPEIEIYMNPGVGICGIGLTPLNSPFDVEDALGLHFGATWDFLLDGTDDIYASLSYGMQNGWIIETFPTVDITGAYLTVDGVIPEPTIIIMLSIGLLGIRLRRKKYSKTFN